MKESHSVQAMLDREIETFLNKSPRPALRGAVVSAGNRFDFSHGLDEHAAEPVFEIGSFGKTFTTTLLAMLVKEGVVSLDDPVSRFRPEYAFGCDVTLRDLACHASGLPSNPVPLHQMMFGATRRLAAFSRADLENFLCQRFARVPVTGRFNYSNPGMALLGHVLGDCLDMSYERAIRERILEPLGMHETRIDPGSYPADRLLAGHSAWGRAVPAFSWPGMEPAGLWRSTVPDMLRFLSAMAGLKESPWTDLAVSMTRPQVKIDSDMDVGLGWMLSSYDGLGTYAWHNGGTFGQHAVGGWLPDHKTVVVILTNRRPPLWHHVVDSRCLERLAARIIVRAAGCASCETRRLYCEDDERELEVVNEASGRHCP